MTGNVLTRKPNYIARQREALAKRTKQQLIDDAINTTLNDLVGQLANYEEGESDPHGHGKRVPYVGWYWRSVDFASSDYRIGDCGSFVGFMENNKWDYPERRMTPDEAAQVTAIVCEAYDINRGGGILSDILANTRAKVDELWPLLQSFPMEIDGYWIYGPQGNVGFAENEEAADRLIESLSAAGGGIAYRKVKA